MRKLASILSLAVVAAACQDGSSGVTAPEVGGPAAVGAVTPSLSRIGPDVDPVFYEGSSNRTCSEFAPAGETWRELKVDPNADGTYTDGFITVVISNSQDDKSFDWSSNFGVDAVFVKAGAGGSYLYRYIPPSTGDDGLSSPGATGNGISHISFCYTPRLQVSKTAVTTFKRTYDWDIAKTSETGELTLSPGQVHDVDYAITAFLAQTPYVDGDWAVSGVITITNPYPLAATITSVTDVVSPDIEADVTCEGGTPSPASPRMLTSGQTLTCSYETDLPDAGARTNTATATVSATSQVQGGSGEAAVTFASTTNDEVNECIVVTDDNGTPDLDSDDVALGTACVNESPKTFAHTITVGPFSNPAQCGEQRVTNTASFVVAPSYPGSDEGSDDHTVVIDVPCVQGCTLTQGYWKTHSHLGPAPYDDAWLNVGPLGSDTPFFNSGLTWYEVFWTAPAGNAYFNLAHQYMAAQLNILNGAQTTSAVDAAILAAQGYFAGIASGTPAPSGALRRDVLQWASTLDQYNNGSIGPGHCSEQNP